jgi:Protein of unknown function (DUF2971)
MELNEYAHPLFRNAPPPDAKLWRYLSFAKLVSLLYAPRLHFTRVDQFDDHFEGAWPKSDLEYWEKVKGLIAIYYTEVMRYSKVAASCWVESPHESAAMWRLYAPGEEGIAITTTFRKLCDIPSTTLKQDPAFSQNDPRGWLAGATRVTYLDHASKGLIEDLGKNEPLPNTMMPFMLKNVSYEHEKEVRALVIAGKGSEIGREGFDLSLNLDEFIDEIVVNPFCQTWFTEAVTGLVDRYGLKNKLRQSALSPSVFYKERFYMDMQERTKGTKG